MPALRNLKLLFAQAAAPLLQLDRRIAAGNGRFVLCYHRIIPSEQAQREWVHEAMWMSPSSFDAQLQWMRSVGEIVSLDRILAAPPRSGPLFAITFDDGWRDNLEQALPIMRRHGVPAAVFICTGCMERGSLIWPDDLAMKTALAAARVPSPDLLAAIAGLSPGHQRAPAGADVRRELERAIEQLKQIGEEERAGRIELYCSRLGAGAEPLAGHMLDWDGVRKLQAAGIEIGSHSHTHRICSEATPEQIEWELVESRRRIRDELGLDVERFAYPNARYGGGEGPILARAGYRQAFRIHNLPVDDGHDPFFIPRFIASEMSWSVPAFFKLRLRGVR